MRWRALQTGRVYVKQHPGDAQLSLDELRDMVGREGQTFSNRVSTVSEYQNFPNSYLLFTKVSMHLSISHSLCSAVHNYDSLCRRSSRSPIMLSILLVYLYIYIYIRVIRRALNLLRASFSPIFQYFSAVNDTRVSFSLIFLTCMPWRRRFVSHGWCRPLSS